jgi:DNA ligase-1
MKMIITQGEIRDAFRALELVANERSTNAKENLLRLHEGNQMLRTLLYYTFNTFMQYYIKMVPEVEPAQKDIDVDNFNKFIELLDRLAKREIHQDIPGHVANFLKYCNAEEQLWYSRVIKRNLEIGIAEKTVNKVYGGYIPVYDVQLADKVADVTLTDPNTLKKLPARFVVQYKIDGYRLNIHKANNGQVSICSRNGVPVKGYSRLEKEAAEYLPSGLVYDGEMVSPKLFKWIEENMLRDDGQKIADRSLFQEAMSKAFSHEINKEGIFNIFDAVKQSEWDSQKAAETYETRIARLDGLVSPIVAKEEVTQMTMVPTSRVFYKDNPDDLAEVVNIFHKFLSWGWEGLMIKNVDAAYEWKRTKNLLKVKLMDTVDLEVLSVVEGTGAGAGMVGKLVCDYKGVKLNIGAGRLTTEEKIAYWKNPNAIIGKTIEVMYQAESVGKNGDPVLDFARYIKLRSDK